ncbi:unnamed protein product [Caretta caretta]
MAYQTFRQEYLQVPPVTRAYTTACVLTTAAVQLELITPFQLYFNPELIFKHFQVWRLITNYLFFGPVGFNFLFNMIFLYRYCRMLEEGSFRGRTADFVFMFLFGGLLMTLFGLFVNLVFLGQAFTIMLVYVWSRRNPYVRMNFFGLLIFQAPFLPWVLMGFSLLLGNSIIVDLLGIAVGHIYFFLEDIFPNQPGGGRLLKTPSLLKAMFDTPEDDPNYNPLPEERPGGFAWGEDCCSSSTSPIMNLPCRLRTHLDPDYFELHVCKWPGASDSPGDMATILGFLTNMPQPRPVEKRVINAVC